MSKLDLVPLDLRNITGRSDVIQTRVRVFPDFGVPEKWLLMGESDIVIESRSSLVATHPTFTDFEHSRVVVVRIPLIGITFKGTINSRTWVEAWVQPSSSYHFHIETPGYNPKVVRKCEDCGDLIVETDYRKTQEMIEVYNQVQGRKVEIFLGPVGDE